MKTHYTFPSMYLAQSWIARFHADWVIMQDTNFSIIATSPEYVEMFTRRGYTVAA